MDTAPAAAQISYRRVWLIAWPIILANSAAPLLGLVDTAVVGRTGVAADLGAIALGALIFNFVHWTFGFLRMGTTGFVAQADGAGDEAEIRATLGRALLIAAVIGVSVVVLQRPIAWVALSLLSASEGVEATARIYVLIRFWGVPATLATSALLGVLIGLGRSGPLLRVQLLLNGLNIVLSIWLGGVLGLGVPGIAAGTVVAEWVALVYAAYLIRGLLRGQRPVPEPFWPRERILDLPKLRLTMQANADIMIRTLLLLFGFSWFTDQGARFGDVVLAGNHILLQFVGFSAFFLDGFAFAAESIVGRAAGARHLADFDRAVHVSSVFAGVTALALSMALLAGGPHVIGVLTDLSEVHAAAARYLPYAAGYVLLSFAAFQLDGIFIGTTRTRDMRNASVLSLAVFLAAWWPLTRWAGNDGLWMAMIIFVVARAVALGLRLQGVRTAIGPKLRDGRLESGGA